MKYFFAFWLAFLGAQLAQAQVVNIVIDSGSAFNSPSEPCIAIDPKNTNNMVAGSNIRNVYHSTNGGLTWSKGLLSSTFGVFGDPVIYADTTGAFYYFHLSNNVAITTWPDWCDRIVCQRLDNLTSATWNNGSYTGLETFPSMQDKPWVAVDRQTNNVYVTWTRFEHYGSTDPTDSSHIFFSKSVDRGDSWSTPVRLNKKGGDCVDDDFTVEGAVPCVGKSGQVFVSWDADDAILFDRSLDGGLTWEHEDRVIATMPGGWAYNVPGVNRCNGLSFMAADLSNGPYSGTLYVNWSDQRNGADNTDVWIIKSTDNGSTWSAPQRVNDDAGARHQFLSSMTVDPSTGYVWVLFYDRRNYTDSLTTDVYLAVSSDGGATFTNHKISETPFRPRADFFFGDYTYISAFNNVVRPVWGRTNVVPPAPPQQWIMTAIIDESIIPVPAGVSSLEVSGNNLAISPNPAIESCMLSYSLQQSSMRELYITDVTGKRVATIASGIAAAGNHRETLNIHAYDMPPGLYFATLKTPGSTQTVKLAVTR